MRKEVHRNVVNHSLSVFQKNMLSKIMLRIDKQHLQKRRVIRSVSNILKNHLRFEHSIDRSLWSYFTHFFT
ncbi:MAG: transposase [Candidatus Babeliaceae bacterium]|nr:transposase [Candidatus Babeliaceae bacterium]